MNSSDNDLALRRGSTCWHSSRMLPFETACFSVCDGADRWSLLGWSSLMAGSGDIIVVVVGSLRRSCRRLVWRACGGVWGLKTRDTMSYVRASNIRPWFESPEHASQSSQRRSRPGRGTARGLRRTGAAKPDPLPDSIQRCMAKRCLLPHRSISHASGAGAVRERVRFALLRSAIAALH